MSKRFLRSAHHSVHRLFKQPVPLSYQTAHDYESNIKLAITQLHEMGYQISNIHHLKDSHVNALLERWHTESLQVETIKNRLSQLRYVTKLIGKPELITSTNEKFLLNKLTSYPNRNRAIEKLDLTKINNEYVSLSINLQRVFGLRREESIKFIPSYADRGQEILLKGSWTKGGIERRIPITTYEQREFLNYLKQIITPGSALIPKDKTYIEQRNVYMSQLQQAGLKNMHGLRHAYAQRRYHQMTTEIMNGNGWECPRKGGPHSNNLSQEQKYIDYVVRMRLSGELGHSRISIVKIYCG